MRLPKAALLFAFLMVPVVYGGTIAFTSPVQIGNQVWTGSLGQDFDVLSTIEVTSLGVFDSGGDGINGTLQAIIYRRSDQSGLFAPVQFTALAPGVLIGGYRLQHLETSITLEAGEYSIVAWGFGTNDRNGNTGCTVVAGSCVSAAGVTGPLQDTGAGAISFIGHNRYSAAAGVFPTTIESDPSSNRYLAGTFEFNEVPEPATFGATGLVLAALAALRRRASRV
jgi:hypothetical protein